MNAAERGCAAAVAVLLLLAGSLVAVRAGSPSAGSFEVDRSGAVPDLRPERLRTPRSGDADLADADLDLPPGTDVYAVRVTTDGGRPSYSVVQAGGGGLASDFWPASSIKVLAAVGALEFAASLGFTGRATVTFDNGISATLAEIYDAAIRDSSNDDYDLLVQIAGLDRLNDEFLAAANGFPATVVGAAYAGNDVALSPGMTFAEDGREAYVPEREATGHDYGCPTGNCSNLFEMVDSVRRVVLDDDIPDRERFRVAAADIGGLRAALLGADGFFNAAATMALGAGTRVYSKPGWVPGLDCVDVAYIDGDGEGFLLGVATPDLQEGEECPVLSTIAYRVLRFLHEG